MRVLLASAPHWDTFGYSMPPPGLLRLGGWLRERGFDVQLEDLAYRLGMGAPLPHHGLLLEREPFDVLGLSVMGATLPAAILIARAMKAARPALPILLGGPGTTGIDRAVLERFDCFDVVVRGEGERSLEELLGAWSCGRDSSGVRGLTWRDAEGSVRREADREPLAMEAVAPYAFELLPALQRYKDLTGEDEGLVPIDSGRGCHYDCSFCTIGRFWGRRSRPLPVERLVAEVLSVPKMPGGKNAYLCHDLFGADREHALAFCDALIERGAPVPWECRARLDHLDEELLERMGRAGCYRVLFGLETADGELRNAHQKHLDPDHDVLRSVATCARVGVIPILSTILGLPGEDEAGLRRTLELCARAALEGGTQLSLHLVNPQPGCGLGEEHGRSSRPVDGIPPDMAWGAGESEEERALIEAHPDLFGTWSLLTGLEGGEAHLRFLHGIAKELPDLLMRLPRTFRLAQRRTKLDALDLYRAWAASGRSFEGFVRARGDALLDAVLAWEHALLREAARGPADAEEAALPRQTCTPLALPFEPESLTRSLREGRDPEEASTLVAVLARDGRLCTLRLGADAFALLQTIDGRSLDALEAELPGIARALPALVSNGLIQLPATATAQP